MNEEDDGLKAVAVDEKAVSGGTQCKIYTNTIDGKFVEKLGGINQWNKIMASTSKLYAENENSRPKITTHLSCL